MNKMPDRIWATPYDSDMDGGTYCDAAERPTSPNHDAWCYVRADLARALPAVQPDTREAALREALLAIDALPEYESPDVNMGVGNVSSAILALIDKPAHVNETPKIEHVRGDVLTPATGDA